MYPLCFISNSSKKLLHRAINKNSVNKLFTLLVNVCQGVHISPRIHILYNISILYCELQRSLTNDMNGNLLPSECLLIYFQYKKMSKVSKKDQQYRCSVNYWQTFTNSYQYQQFITEKIQLEACQNFSSSFITCHLIYFIFKSTFLIPTLKDKKIFNNIKKVIFLIF